MCVRDEPALPGVVAPFGGSEHICLMYRTAAEQFASVIPWIRFGLEQGERCIYIADDNEIGTVRAHLGAQGIGEDSAVQRGVLLVAAGAESLVRRGSFSLDAFFSRFEDFCVKAQHQGSSVVRVAGEMTWALSGQCGLEGFLEFEARLNKISKPRLRTMCQFNLNRFGSTFIREIVRIHPHIVFEGRSYSNSQSAASSCHILDGAQFDANLLLQNAETARPPERTAHNSEIRNRMPDGCMPEAIVSEGPARADLDPLHEPNSLLLESIPAGVLITNRSGLITYVNARAESILQTTRRKLVGQRFETQRWCIKNIHGHLLTDDWLPESRVRATGLANFDTRLVFEWTDESRTYVSMSAAPFGYLGGRPSSTILLIADISESIETEAQNQRQQRESSQFQRMEAIATLAGGIAHDFNNLLGGIMACVSLIDLQLGREFRFHEDLSEIKALVERGAELTRQLLGFAHRGKYVPAPMDLNAVVSDLATSFCRTRKDISTVLACSGAGAFVSADKAQTQQLLVNLLLNARQAMPNGGTITLGTESVLLSMSDVSAQGVPPGRYIKLFVTDSGVGMSEDTCKRIFEPFFTTRQFGRGAGLGLASVFGIVKNHGGFITVHSQLGEGSTFAVYLPAIDPHTARKRPVSVSSKGSQGMILVVDDEPYILRSNQRLLKAMGYKVLTARGGSEAINIFKQHPNQISLVILDMIMPGLNGRDTFEALREIAPNVKVLLCSGYSAEGEASEIMRRGCNAFIQKPFDSDELAAKLREVL
jgi:two-component system cell cycle sensor histidine kinase/response regulator CckA